MTEDATLTDFFEYERRDDDRSDPHVEAKPADSHRDGAPEIDEAESENEDPDADANVAVDVSDSPTEPAVTTYAWGTYVCGACGSSIERVWIDDADHVLVCDSCKEW